jgi:hypothetical protein
MAGTSLSEIVDLFSTNVDDYNLNTIYTTSGSAGLNTFVEPWLLNSIEDFDICDQSLDYTPISGTTDGTFAETLTMSNKLMLSQMMVLYWAERDLQDIRKMNNFIKDHDFVAWAPSSTIKAKQDYINVKKEEISQRLINYGYSRNPWAEWEDQNFNIP